MKLQTQEEQSKYLSFLLRHKPEAAKLVLDKEGWVKVADILQNTTLTLENIYEIVKTDAKGRYTILNNEQGEFIRANQGHSTSSVQLTFAKAIPPTVLYHGTDSSVLSLIQKMGLLPMKRHHVHLSIDLNTAVAVSARRKNAVLLSVDSKSMLTAGYNFFLSTNGIWLTANVPAKYIKAL